MALTRRSIAAFSSGIGQLLLRSGAPAVPAYIGGTFEALPRGRRLPRLRRLTVKFGPALSAASLRAIGTGRTDEERVADGLRQKVAALPQPSCREASP